MINKCKQYFKTEKEDTNLKSQNTGY